MADLAATPAVRPGQVFVVMSASAVEIQPRGGLAFSPWQPIEPAPRAGVFQEAEALEFQRQDPEKAATIYRRLAESGPSAVRAGALVRLGRILRRERRWPDALRVYDELAKPESLPVAGMPAALVANAARCSILEESGQRQPLQKAAQVSSRLSR